MDLNEQDATTLARPDVAPEPTPAEIVFLCGIESALFVTTHDCFSQYTACSVTDASSNPSGTLYNPPSGSSESGREDDEKVELELSLPEERAERLRAVAQQLGLTPSTVARRAIEMICDEVVTIQDDARPPTLLVDQYQARIDLLHSIDHAEDAPVSREDNAPADTA